MGEKDSFRSDTIYKLRKMAQGLWKPGLPAFQDRSFKTYLRLILGLTAGFPFSGSPRGSGLISFRRSDPYLVLPICIHDI